MPEFKHYAGVSRRHGVRKKSPQSLGRNCSCWSTKLHLVAVDDYNVVTWSLVRAQADDAPEGKRLIEWKGLHTGRLVLMMDRVYKDDATRA